MLRGLWQLTWLETKIFVREPLGLFGTVLLPVVAFVFFGRMFGGPSQQVSEPHGHARAASSCRCWP